ncbi:MAG: PqqD family protein [Gemmatimonadaceae bacterium]|jgi:hypothetical protein|nr:PqqD family protein [Gemmatimonadaceae bacterium]
MVTVRPKPSVLAARLPGEAVLLDLEAKRYFQLNESAAVIWDALAAGDAPDAVAAQLVTTFDVTHAEAARAVAALCETLAAHALVAPTTA